MTNTVIRTNGLSKKYVIGHRQPDRLREAITDAVGSWTRRLLAPKKALLRPGQEEFWALKDVSFEIQQGEKVGIIGRNGAGKSTLLKIFSRITEPTEGRVTLRGQVASLLEVGTGFHPELTGRENIFLNGAILGMSKAEIVRKFDDIVNFAEVEKFLDTPVKRYSSGMYVRLAFAVAAHLEPEILIVDEVLAVGDATFQNKCLDKMESVAREGRTVLVVSHNMATIQKLCSRALLLQKGKLVFDGEPDAAIRRYIGADQPGDGRLNLSRRESVPRRVEVIDAWLEHNRQSTDTLLFGDAATVFVEIEIHEPTLFSVELVLRQGNGEAVAFSPSGLAQDWEIEGTPGRCTVRAQLPPAHLAKGRYSIDIILADTGVCFLDRVESAVAFTMDGSAVGRRNWIFTQSSSQGCLLWEVQFNQCSLAAQGSGDSGLTKR